MQVSSGDAVVVLDNTSNEQMEALLEVFPTLLEKLDSLTTLSLRITEQLDLIMAVGVAVLICAICYVILHKFTRF